MRKISKLENYNIVGIGELLWDILPDGKNPGGAPANFSYHTKNLGANSTIISAIGTDPPGDEIKAYLHKINLDYALNYSKYPTGAVTVDLKDGIPEYVIHEPVAWDDISLDIEAISILKKAHAICFGTLAQRSDISRQAIQKALKLVNDHALRIFDMNLRQHYFSKDLITKSLLDANMLKLNADELMVLSGYFNLSERPEVACSQLLIRFDLDIVALTNGGENSVLVTREEISVLDSPKVKVVDTIGAGDAFTAALVIGLLMKAPLKQIHRQAADYAAKVCTHKGAIPVI